MKKTIILILISTICISLMAVTIRAADDEDQWDKAEKALLELMSEMPSLSDKFPDDLEIQLGIAALYFKYGAPKDPSIEGSDEFVLDQNQKFFGQCEKVFSIDPNNKPGLALYSRKICWGFTSKRTYTINLIERKISQARKLNSKEFFIAPYNPLIKYFSEEDKCVSSKEPAGVINGKQEYYLNINDFDLAVRQLQEKIDEEVPSVLTRLNNAQNRDPNNAFYNYLKAHFFLALDEKDEALKEIEEGVSKKYFNSYPEELAKAKNKVLQKAGLTKNYRDFIFGIRSPFESIVYSEIWKKGLSDLGKEYEARGEMDKAERIYRLTIEMAKQVQKEFIYEHSGGLDKEAQKRINQLSDKNPEK